MSKVKGSNDKKTISLSYGDKKNPQKGVVKRIRFEGRAYHPKEDGGSFKLKDVRVVSSGRGMDAEVKRDGVPVFVVGDGTLFLPSGEYLEKNKIFARVANESRSQKIAELLLIFWRMTYPHPEEIEKGEGVKVEGNSIRLVWASPIESLLLPNEKNPLPYDKARDGEKIPVRIYVTKSGGEYEEIKKIFFREQSFVASGNFAEAGDPPRVLSLEDLYLTNSEDEAERVANRPGGVPALVVGAGELYLPAERQGRSGSSYLYENGLMVSTCDYERKIPRGIFNDIFTSSVLIVNAHHFGSNDQEEWIVTGRTEFRFGRLKDHRVELGQEGLVLSECRAIEDPSPVKFRLSFRVEDGKGKFACADASVDLFTMEVRIDNESDQILLPLVEERALEMAGNKKRRFGQRVRAVLDRLQKLTPAAVAKKIPADASQSSVNFLIRAIGLAFPQGTGERIMKVLTEILVENKSFRMSRLEKEIKAIFAPVTADEVIETSKIISIDSAREKRAKDVRKKKGNWRETLVGESIQEGLDRIRAEMEERERVADERKEGKTSQSQG